LEPDLFINFGSILSYNIYPVPSFPSDLHPDFFGYLDIINLDETNNSGYIISGFAFIFGFKSKSDGTLDCVPLNDYYYIYILMNYIICIKFL